MDFVDHDWKVSMMLEVFLTDDAELELFAFILDASVQAPEQSQPLISFNFLLISSAIFCCMSGVTQTLSVLLEATGLTTAAV